MENYRINNAVRLAEECRKKAHDADRERLLILMRFRPLFENRQILCFFLDRIEEYKTTQHKLGNYEVSDAIRKILPEMSHDRAWIYTNEWVSDFIKWRE